MRNFDTTLANLLPGAVITVIGDDELQQLYRAFHVEKVLEAKHIVQSDGICQSVVPQMTVFLGEKRTDKDQGIYVGTEYSRGGSLRKEWGWIEKILGNLKTTPPIFQFFTTFPTADIGLDCRIKYVGVLTVIDTTNW